MAAVQREPLVVDGRSLTLGWGKESGGGGGEGGGSAAARAPPTVDLHPPHDDAVTLFVAGLPSVYLQEDLAALLRVAPSAVRPVLGRDYCFADAPSHLAAAGLVAAASASPLVLLGRTLAVGWARESAASSSHGGGGGGVSTEPPAPDACSLFVGGLTAGAAEADVRALFGPGEREQAAAGVVSVHKPAGRTYAFVHFASHAGAADALARLAPGEEGEPARAVVAGAAVRLGWARGRSDGAVRPAGDCWFCLGSPSLRAHLLLAVGEHAYLALPRGAIAADHVLVAPIECCPSRLLLPAGARAELERFEGAVRRLHGAGGRETLLFERTLRGTRGRDHMQTHLVALPGGAARRCLEVLSQLAAERGLAFSEVSAGGAAGAGQALDEALGPHLEYFYLQLPGASPGEVRRFLHVPPGEGEGGRRCPMALGLELAARALGCPERADWKRCLLSDSDEEKEAEAFKQRFAPFDFT